jgi:hypothetical protein
VRQAKPMKSTSHDGSVDDLAPPHICACGGKFGHRDCYRAVADRRPRQRQFCEKDGKRYRCGQQAALALSDKTGQATIRCEQRDIDRYKRIVAVCSLGNVDLNAWMVRQGWAIAYCQYSRDYVDHESAAQAEKTGIWAGRFINPSRWRRGDRLAVESAKEPAATSCQIKGNISRSGERIYHVPGGRDYGPTRIDESKGERWFCSEDEARKAGWRRPRQ